MFLMFLFIRESCKDHPFNFKNSKIKTYLIIKLSLESISQTIKNESGYPTTYNFLNHEKISTYTDNYRCSYLNNHIYNIEKTLQKYFHLKQNQKFWRWDDYKKIVELAGNIT